MLDVIEDVRNEFKIKLTDKFEEEVISFLNTNVVNSNITQTDENIFRTFPSIINTFMLGFFNKTEIKIIHPVAIYY